MKNLISILSVIAVLAIVSATSARSWAAPTGGATAAACADETRYPLITKTELTNVVQKKSATIIDVNSADSFKTASVPGSFNYGAHSKDFAQLLPQDKSAMIVAYCGGPACTAWKKAAEQACQMGYTNIRHFKGGISGWVKKDG